MNHRHHQSLEDGSLEAQYISILMQSPPAKGKQRSLPYCVFQAGGCEDTLWVPLGSRTVLTCSHDTRTVKSLLCQKSERVRSTSHKVRLSMFRCVHGVLLCVVRDTASYDFHMELPALRVTLWWPSIIRQWNKIGSSFIYWEQAIFLIL